MQEADTCEFCGGYASFGDELVHTAKGLMHEECAEDVFGVDHGASVWPS